MGYKVEIQDGAYEDVDVIIDYLKSKSAVTADRFYSSFKECIANLEEGLIDYGLSRFPKLASQGYHAVYFSNYVMLYFQSEDTRTIAHVFHQRQNYFNII